SGRPGPGRWRWPRRRWWLPRRRLSRGGLPRWGLPRWVPQRLPRGGAPQGRVSPRGVPPLREVSRLPGQPLLLRGRSLLLWVLSLLPRVLSLFRRLLTRLLRHRAVRRFLPGVGFDVQPELFQLLLPAPATGQPERRCPPDRACRCRALVQRDQ